LIPVLQEEVIVIGRSAVKVIKQLPPAGTKGSAAFAGTPATSAMYTTKMSEPIWRG